MSLPVWLWLPIPETLHSGMPVDGAQWAEEVGFTSVDLAVQACSFAALARKLGRDTPVATACTGGQLGWIPHLAQEFATFEVYGPDIRCCTRYQDGVPTDTAQAPGGRLLPQSTPAIPTHTEGTLPDAAAAPWAQAARRESLRAGWDPDLAVLAPLADARPPKAPFVVFEGTDGAGKSTQAARAAAFLNAQGRPAEVRRSCRGGEFYRHVSRILQRTVSAGDPRGWRFARLVKVFDSLRIVWSSLSALEKDQILVWDRYLETHLAACRMRFGNDVGLASLIDSAPRPLRSWFLDLPPEQGLDRVKARGEAPTLDEHEIGARRYRLAFRAQARAGRMQPKDAAASIDHLAEGFAEGLTRCVTENQGDPGATDALPADDSHLAALRHAMPQLHLPDVADLLLDRILCEREESRRFGSTSSPAVEVWPPLLRAVHGFPTGIDALSLLDIDPGQGGRLPDFPEIPQESYRFLFRSERAWSSYCRRAARRTRFSEAIEVVGILLRREDGHLFLERRSPNRWAYPLAWDSPGGKIEGEERPREAAVREMEEEYGLCLQAGDLEPLGTMLDLEPTTGIPFRHHIYLAPVAEAPSQASEESIDSLWVSPSQARSLADLARPLRLLFSARQEAVQPISTP